MRSANLLLLSVVLLVVVAVSRGDETPPATAETPEKLPATSETPTARSADPKVAPGTDDFSGKVALVFLDQLIRSPSMVLTDVEIKEISGRTFLMGVAADTARDDDWRGGKQIRISWPLVTGYMLFTHEQYAKHVKDAREEPEANQ